MKKIIISAGLILLGILMRLYANAQTYIDESGVLHDSKWLLIGSFMMLFGMVWLVVLGLCKFFSKTT